MKSFIVKRRPLSYNSCKGKRKVQYKNDLETSVRNYHPTVPILSGNLYGIVYYFFNQNIRLDTDNLSKPIWDCLTNFLFNDDDQIKFRTAGSFDLTSRDYDFNVIDLTGLSGKMVDELTDAILNENHVLYIECGKFKQSMFKFSIE